MNYLQPLDYFFIALYGVFVVGVGIWCGRKQKSTEEYYVAGRGVGSFIVGISMVATLLSTISYLVIPGEMIKNGPGFMWSIIHIPLSFLIVGFLFIPKIMKHKITSGYELLHEKFGFGIRRAASFFFVISRVIWMGLIIFTCSKAVVEVTGLPFPVVVAAVGIVGSLYTVIGGIRAVMITDVAQFIILFGGALLCLGYITYQCGGFSWWPDWSSPQLASLQWQETKVFSLNPFDRMTVINVLLMVSLWWICTAAADQVVIQRYLCTRNTRSARRSFLNCILADAGIMLVLCLVGIALVGFYLKFPERLAGGESSIAENADKLFPQFIGQVLPGGLSGLLIAALFAAAMSSLDSGISSIGTVLMVDFKPIFARGCSSDKQQLTRAKIIGIFVGILGIGLCYLMQFVPRRNFFDIAQRISVVIVPVASVFILAFFVKFSTRPGAWAAILTGFFSGVLFSYWEQIVGLFAETSDFSVMLILPLSLAISLGSGIVVSLFTRSCPSKTIQV